MNRKILQQVIQKSLANGQLIETGWEAFSQIVVPVAASEEQRRDMRIAFFAGAQLLWDALMVGMDDAAEPTANDERRMAAIQAELDRFEELLLKRIRSG